jgi:hypothetical protein
MSEFPKHQSSEYVSKHKLSPEELKLAIKNSSKFLSAHTRVEMLHYFDQDPWIARQMAYYMKILDEENWEGKKMLEEVMDREWKAHKKLMGFKDVFLTKPAKGKQKE